MVKRIDNTRISNPFKLSKSLIAPTYIILLHTAISFSLNIEHLSCLINRNFYNQNFESKPGINSKSFNWRFSFQSLEYLITMF